MKICNMSEQKLLKERKKTQRKMSFLSVGFDIDHFFQRKGGIATFLLLALVSVPACFLVKGLIVLPILFGSVAGYSWLCAAESIMRKDETFSKKLYKKYRIRIEDIERELNNSFGYNFIVDGKRPHEGFGDKLTDEQKVLVEMEKNESVENVNLINSLREKMEREKALNAKKRIAYINARTHGKNHKEAMKISQEINMDNNVDGDNNITI